MTHVVCESKLRLVVRSSMHPCPGNWMTIGHAVVYFAQAAHSFSAGIKCRHCSISITIFSKMITFPIYSSIVWYHIGYGYQSLTMCRIYSADI